MHDNIERTEGWRWALWQRTTTLDVVGWMLLTRRSRCCTGVQFVPRCDVDRVMMTRISVLDVVVLAVCFRMNGELDIDCGVFGNMLIFDLLCRS
ncbi:hypothetical protein [Neorhodopirellula lusitana]|uniref:hypothetical protein n=1 Tax=Neorhodopirellula lusitana TaxID=445327 RepID=UPI003850A45D